MSVTKVIVFMVRASWVERWPSWTMTLLSDSVKRARFFMISLSRSAIASRNYFKSIWLFYIVRTT
jgi:hypothetical protein